MINKIEEAEEILGIKIFNNYLNNATTFEEAKKRFSEMKKKARKAYKQKAKKLHPDLNPETDGEEMKKLNNAIEFIEKIKIKPKQPVRQYVRIIFGSPMYADTSTASTDIDFTGYNPWW